MSVIINKNLYRFEVEIWILYCLGMLFTVLRLAARIRSHGWKGLQADDYLACLAMAFYTAGTAIAQLGGALYLTNANVAALFAPPVLESLPADDPQYRAWVRGAEYHFASWPTYVGSLWCLKMSVLVFYGRMTVGLAGGYRARIRIGYFLMGISWVVVTLTTFLACRPFGRLFSAHPYPSNVCQSAVSKPIVWVTYAFNIITDLYLIALPMPMLWHVKIALWRKISLIVLFSGGLVVIAFATTRCVLVAIGNSFEGALLAAMWAMRENFVAVMTTNMPMAFALVKALLWSPLRSQLKSSKGGTGSKQSSRPRDASLKELETIGGSSSKGSRGKAWPYPLITDPALFSASEEAIISGTDSMHLAHLSGSTLESPGVADLESSRPQLQPVLARDTGGFNW